MRLNIVIKHYNLIDYQKDFILAQTKITALIGGTGCGKTFILAVYLLTKILELSQKKKEVIEIIVMAPTHKMLLRNPLKYITNTFNEMGVAYKLNKSEMTIVMDNALLYLISAEAYESIQGIHADAIVMDEAGLMAKPVLDTALQRIAFKNGQLALLTTPYSSNHWLKTEIYDAWLEGDNNIFVTNPKSRNNPFYPLEEIERAKKMLPEWKYKMFFEATFSRPVGLIFEEIEYVKAFDIPPHYQYFRGVDFGFNNPSAVVQLAIDPNSDIIYVIGEFKESKKNLDDLDHVLKSGSGAIYADAASPDAIDTLKWRGHQISKATKNVLAGISMLDAMFRTKKLFVFDNLPKLRDELESYRWLVDKQENLTDRPTKENDHLIDALRYAIYTYSGNLEKGNAMMNMMEFAEDLY